MADIFSSLWSGMCAAGPAEQAATILGILGVWLMIRESLWAFPVGLVQVCLSAWVFFEARLYADMGLQAVFFAVLAYGWWHWTHPDGHARGELPVSGLSLRGRLGSISAGLVCTALWGWCLSRYTDAAMPYRDAFITAFSIVAQWLQARKKLENWHAWILVNATAAPVYWLNGLYWFAFLYTLFLFMALGGFIEWRRSALRASSGAAAAPASAATPASASTATKPATPALP